MSTTRFPPNVVYLGGPYTEVGEYAASEAITPGMLIESFVGSSKLRWRKHSTAAGPCVTVALDQSMINAGVDTAYAADDLVQALVLGGGTSFWGLIGSGVGVIFGDKLESAGNGKLRAWTTSVTPLKALETISNGAGLTDARIRVENY